MDNSINIPIEYYEDLIRAQMKLEQLITAREKYLFVFEGAGASVFDAIVGGGE